MNTKTVIFDGRSFAKQREQQLQRKVRSIGQRGIKPKLVAVLVGDDPASRLYVNLKRRFGEKIGVRVDVHEFESKISVNQLIKLIKKLNTDQNVHGVMVQLPLPNNLILKTKDILDIIDSAKDVDGLRSDSKFVPAAVKAVVVILDEALKIVRPPLKDDPYKVVVVGAKGVVGNGVVDVLSKDGRFETQGVDIETKDLASVTKNTDILVSATGQPSLIKGNIVKDGTIVIDVGAPKGDVEFESVSKKASFITPVPGGVGPVTVSCLFENLLQAVASLQ